MIQGTPRIRTPAFRVNSNEPNGIPHCWPSPSNPKLATQIKTAAVITFCAGSLRAKPIKAAPVIVRTKPTFAAGRNLFSAKKRRQIFSAQQSKNAANTGLWSACATGHGRNSGDFASGSNRANSAESSRPLPPIICRFSPSGTGLLQSATHNRCANWKRARFLRGCLARRVDHRRHLLRGRDRLPNQRPESRLDCVR